MRPTFTKEELVSGLWVASDKEGSIVARKAIDFDNLTFELENTADKISFTKSLVGMTQNEVNYVVEFKPSISGNGTYELQRFSLLGSELSPQELSKEDVRQLVDTFNLEFKAAPQKINNFTHSASTAFKAKF